MVLAKNTSKGVFLCCVQITVIIIVFVHTRDVHKSLTWSLSQVWSLWSSESRIKSFNGSQKNPIQNPHVLKSSYLWSCFIGYRQNIWSMICFVKKKEVLRCNVYIHPACYLCFNPLLCSKLFLKSNSIIIVQSTMTHKKIFDRYKQQQYKLSSDELYLSHTQLCRV